MLPMTPGELHHRFLEHVSPPSVLVNQAYEIVHYSASASRFLRVSEAEALQNLLSSVHPMLRADVVASLDAAAKTHRAATAVGVPVQIGDSRRVVDIRVSPAGDLSPGCLVVIFVEHNWDGSDAVTSLNGKIAAHAEQELARIAADSERQRRVYETVLTNTPDFVYVFSLDHRVVYANDALVKMWGLSYEETIGKTFLEIGYEPWHAEMHDREIDQVRSTRKSIRGQVPFTGTVGRREYDYIFVPVIGADGEVEAVAGTTRDVTERKEAEQAIRAGEERLRIALAAAHMVAWEWTTLDGNLRVSENAANVFGLQPGDELTKNDQRLALLHPDDLAAYQNTYRKAIEARGSYLTRYRLVRPADGRTIWIEERGHAIFDQPDGNGRLIGVAADITDRVQVEAERERLLLQAEGELGRLADVFRQSPAFMCVLRGPSHVFEMANDRYHAVVGNRELLGKTVLEALPEVREQGFIELLDRVYATGEPFIGTGVRLQLEQSAEQYVDFVYQALRDADGHIVGIVVVGVDVTARHRAEAALRLSEERFRTLFETMDEGFCMVEMEYDAAGRATDYRILTMNPAFEKHTGMHGLAGKSIRQAIPALEEFWYQTYGRVASTGEKIRFVHQASAMGGRWFDVSAFPIGGIGSNIVAILFNDISERRQAEERLRASEARHSFAVTLADAIRPLSDTKAVQAEACRILGEWLGANRVAYVEVCGTDYEIQADYTDSAASIVGRYPIASFGLDQLMLFQAGSTASEADVIDHSSRQSSELEAFAAMQVRSYVAVPLHKNGVFVAGLAVHATDVRAWTQIEIEIIEDTADRTWAAVERVRVEHQLRQSEERSAFVRRSSGVGFWYCDLPFDVLQWDDLVKAHFHLPPDATVTIETFYDRIHPDDREPTRRAIEQSIANRTHYSTNYRTIDPDTAAVTWVRAIGRTFYAENGTPIRFDGVTLDVSDQKLAEARLLESEQRFREMANAAPAMIWVTNQKHECTFLSQSWFDFTGQTSAEGLVFGWTTAVHPDDRERSQKTFLAAAAKGESFELEYRLRTVNGNYRWAIDAGKPRFNEAGEFYGFVGSVIDDDERHEFQLALNEAREAAEASNASKTAFLANMSHEIRTPMTAILGYADLLKDLVHQDDAIQHLQTIRNNGYYLLDIINDILDISKIEAGKLDIESEQFEPLRLIEDVRSIMEIRGRDGGLSLTVHYEGKLPKTIQSDVKRLKQILINLVGNAIKFTHQGEVQIRVRFDVNTRQLQFDVVDTGIGISDEQMERLFKPFSQGDASVSRNFGGTGLGLVISQRLAEMLGGFITMQSTEGVGSTFSVTIPTGESATLDLVDYESMRPRATAQSETRLEQLPKISCHVLVVDDRRDIRFLSKQILTQSGATVKECEDGLIAVEHVTACLRDGGVPDLILLDMQMPNLDGYSTARRLRSLGYVGPIIALTADAMQSDMNKCLEVGCDDYLSKPINKSELLRKVAELTRPQNPSA